MALLVAIGAFAMPSAAQAATAAEVTSLQFQSSYIEDGSQQRLNVNWKAPAASTAPVTITVPLPITLLGNPDSFLIKANGEPAGSCSVTTGLVSCELNEDYVAAHQGAITGVFTFWVTVNLKTTIETVHKFDFGDAGSTTVTVRPNPNTQPCAETNSCDFPGMRTYKLGNYDSATNTVSWAVRIQASPQGTLPIGSNIKVTDNFDASAYELAGQPTVSVAKHLIPMTWGDGSWFPDWSNSLPANEYTVSDGGRTVEFTSGPGTGDAEVGQGQKGLEGALYMVHWRLKVLDPKPGATHTNTADWWIDSEEKTPVTATVVATGGGGEVEGDEVGTFSLTKAIDGTGAGLVPDGKSFFVRYQWAAGAGFDGGSGILEVRSGEGAARSQLIPAGARVTFDEVQKPNVDGGSWSAATFNPAAIDIVGAKDVAVTLTNTFTADPIKVGKFSVQKVVDGTGSALVGNDVEFTVNYSWPDGTGYTGGSGELTVSKGGAAVESKPIPVGAVVTLDEATPADVAGGTWGAPVFSDDEVTITDASVTTPIGVTLTNTFTADPPAPKLGKFSVQKLVDGTGADLVGSDVGFTVKYSWPDGDGFTGDSGELTVSKGGAAVLSKSIPVGAKVKLVEATASTIAGGKWTGAKFTLNDVTITDASVTAPIQVTLTNTFTRDIDPPKFGQFSVKKVVDGTSASNLPADTKFTVNYSWPAGDDFAEGEGSLEVIGGGAAVTSDDIPVGAVVTLIEGDLPKIKGHQWVAGEFSEPTFTIADGAAREVTLTNTLEPEVPIVPEKPDAEDPKPSKPTDPKKPEPKTPGLSKTGAGDGALWLGAGLVLAAGGVLIARRRAQRGAAS